MSVINERLRITEIFYSLQGEANTVGYPTVFVRLTGCPLRCQYCDTAYAFHGGNIKSLDEIIHEINAYGAQYVCVTGGEPLAQPASIFLMSKLCDLGYRVSIETSGARPVSDIDSRVHIVMDLKTPDSQEEKRNLYDNLKHLKPSDEIKFVICSRDDYLWAVDMVNQYQLNKHFHVLFSPSFGQIQPRDLADWIIQDKLQVRFQLQLHKILWNDEPGR